MAMTRKRTMNRPTSSTASAENQALFALLLAIQGQDKEARVAAIEKAPLVGTRAIVPLGGICSGPDRGAAKAAGEALRRVVHHTARPGATAERKAATTQLLRMTRKEWPRQQRVEALYLLGLVGGSESIPAIMEQMKDPDVNEEARMALERIPGAAATHALQRASRTATPNLRPAIEQALRHRAARMQEIGIRK
jgi:HEAT repeat protein